jgi:hypothetical protein
LGADDAACRERFSLPPLLGRLGRTGEFETVVPNWSKGDEFMTGEGRRFRILGIVPVPDDLGVFNAFWKVEPVSD